MVLLSIGQAARRTGLGIDTLRFYERRGLLERPRRSGSSGYRLTSAGPALGCDGE